MSPEETKNAILKDLKENGESCIKDISTRIDTSSSTVSKYLGFLEIENQVKCKIIPPRKYYSIKEE